MLQWLPCWKKKGGSPHSSLSINADETEVLLKEEEVGNSKEKTMYVLTHIFFFWFLLFNIFLNINHIFRDISFYCLLTIINILFKVVWWEELVYLSIISPGQVINKLHYLLYSSSITLVQLWLQCHYYFKVLGG